MSKLYKKEEESLLNKKKKREEIKQKNKLEKSKVNKNYNGINQYNNFLTLTFFAIDNFLLDGNLYKYFPEFIFLYFPWVFADY